MKSLKQVLGPAAPIRPSPENIVSEQEAQPPTIEAIEAIETIDWNDADP